MKLRLLTLGALLWLLLSPACAQMTFTLSGGLNFSDYAERNALDGSTTVTLPSGTNLNGLITAVKIDGVTVEASDIIPNPTQTKINYDELKIFTYQNKAYGFRFTEDLWFTAVFISDCHTGQGNDHDGTSAAQLETIMNNIIAMGKDGQQKVQFAANTSYVPKASIIFCLGDIDQDKGDDGSSGTHNNFLGATATVAKTAGVPFIFIAGNHDLSPDYWTGDNPDKGTTVSGSNADDETISAITTNNNYWNSQGVFDENIQYFIDDSKSSSNYFQSKPFTFRFKGVRFYCAHTTSIYGSSTSGIDYNDANSANTLKKNPLSAIMAKAAGKVNGQVQHFSGHYHRFDNRTYTNTVASDNQVHDYTVAAPGNTSQTNNAYVVLMKRGVGVVEVKQAQF